MKNRTINEKYKGSTYGKIKKCSVVWVRVNTEKDNNIRYIMLLKFFYLPMSLCFSKSCKTLPNLFGLGFLFP